MPSNLNPLGALPARFRRPRLLVIGCGDVGLRVLRPVVGRLRVRVLTSSPERVDALRALGVVPLVGQLDDPASLRRLAGLAPRVLHLAPPPGVGRRDPRTWALARALRTRTPPAALVYGSTTGVYGDCGGQFVDETRRLSPETERAHRRVDAEDAVWHLVRAGTRASVLRIPGIYAPDREGGTPEARLRRGTPVLRPEDDVYTNHIHADDLARACWLALWRAAPARAYNISDDSQLRMGDYYDLAARLFGLPPPPRVDRDEARRLLSPATLSFMGESRRVRNERMKRELRLRLRHPTVADGLAVGSAAAGVVKPG